MIDLINICKYTLARLAKTEYEIEGSSFCERLIFPAKDLKGNPSRRVSEQELRFLFIEEFKKFEPDLFYSVETPTSLKYEFGKPCEKLNDNDGITGTSGSLDMCVFQREKNQYSRLLNIEFKHTNCAIENIGKDLLKLMKEEQNGAFIHLLDNTDNGTLCNDNENKQGVFDKYLKCFEVLHNHWKKGEYIEFIIMSLKQNTLLYRKIHKFDLGNLDKIFFKGGCGNIETIENNGWQKEKIEI